MAPPKVSVCVPTYNRAPLLRECLASIVAQSFTDFELLVLDNCSTDETPTVVAEIDDPRLVYHRNGRNIGHLPNMNLAIARARGEYIVIAHDDDVYLPSFLEREAALLDAHPTMAMVHCAVYETTADGRRRRVVRAYRGSGVHPGRAQFIRFLRGHNVCCSSVMVPRRAYAAAGVFEPRFLCADFHLWLRLALCGDVGYISEPLVEMRVHAGATTNSLEPARWHREFVAIVDEALALAAASDPGLERRRRPLLRAAAYAQGRRFFVAALAAAARGHFDLARGYAGVLRELQALGLPRVFALAARLLIHPRSHGVLVGAARVRAAAARGGVPSPTGSGRGT